VLAEIVREHLLRFPYPSFIEQLFRGHVVSHLVRPEQRTRV
jgi:hypothetical protein